MIQQFGTVAAAGDINGDGYADFLISPAGITGVEFLAFGGPTPSASDWLGMTPPNRITLLTPDTAVSNHLAFARPAAAGDVNGDGIADFLIGENSWDSGEDFGFVHIYLGTTSPSDAAYNGASAPNRIDLVTPDTTRAFGGGFGGAVSSAGDINGDGYSDLVVGAVDAEKAYVFFGGVNRGDADWNGVAPPQRAEIDAPAGMTYYGWSVASAGDVNGDGYADILVGAGNDPALHTIGAAYLYLGGATTGSSDWNAVTTTSRIDLVTPDGQDGRFSTSLKGVGDVDGDGYGDFLIGAPDAPLGGAAHLNFGRVAPDATIWNGTTAPARLDLAPPDAASGGLGGSVD